jgi:hypothetical protein
LDPYVFGPLGSRFFFHQAKIVKKNLIPTVLWLLYDILSLKIEKVLSGQGVAQCGVRGARMVNSGNGGIEAILIQIIEKERNSVLELGSGISGTPFS